MISNMCWIYGGNMKIFNNELETFTKNKNRSWNKFYENAKCPKVPEGSLYQFLEEQYHFKKSLNREREKRKNKIIQKIILLLIIILRIFQQHQLIKQKK